MQHARLLSIAIAVLALAHNADAKPKAKPKQPAKAAKAPKQSAKEHVDAATKAHKDGKFDVALTELKAAYEIDPQPKLLFAIAQVYAKLDDCSNAVDNYEKFLAATKDKQKQAVVKQAIAACKAKPDVVASAPPPDDKADVFRKSKVEETPTEAPPPVVETQPTPEIETPPAPTPTPVVSEPLPAGPTATVTVKKPFYKDILGDVLVVGGVAAGVVSFLQYRGAVSKLDDAEHAGTLADYEATIDDAHSQRTVSVILAGGAVVLVGAGVFRYATHSRTETHPIAIVPTKTGGFVTWTGGF
ncbi:MAG TPA: hypothetical protein VL326_06950 [Kofleriaceae bacterium]|jgi:hypothetical protein|nr:hypothetical protein [Kofleriaceae bacterium]